VKRVTKWFMADADRELRTIVVVVAIAMIILVVAGILLSLRWPANQRPMLESLILNIIATLIGVMVAILTAIFIVERYLERRQREAAQKAALQEELYQAQWQGYAYGGIAIISWMLVQISLFIAYGRSHYAELARRDIKEVPDSISDFMSALKARFKREVEESENTSNKPEDKTGGWTEDYAIRLKKAFKEMTPRKIAPSRRDLIALVSDLERFDVLLRDQISIFQPFIERHMGVWVAMVELARWLRKSIIEVNGILASSMVEEESVGELSEDFTSLFCKIGESAITMRQMLSAGPKDIEIMVNGLAERHKTS